MLVYNRKLISPGMLFGLTFLIIISGLQQVNGQSLQEYRKVSDFVGYLDSIIFSGREIKTFPALNIFNESDPCPADSIFTTRLSTLKKLARSQNGLEMNGGYFYRSGSTSSVSNDINDITTPYHNRFQLGLSWDVYGSSIYQRDKKLRLLEIENQRQKNDYQYAVKKQAFYKARAYIMDMYSWQMCKLLNIRSGILAFVRDLIVPPFMEESLWLHLKLQGEWEEVNIEAETYKQAGYDPGTVEFFSIAGEYAVLDSLRFLNCVVQNNEKVVDAGYDLEGLDVRKSMVAYGNTVKVVPFVRGQYYLKAEEKGSSRNVDFGLNFSLPVSGETRYKRQSIESEQTVAAINRDQVIKGMVQKAHEILNSEKQLILSANQSLNRILLMHRSLLRNRLVIKYSSEYYDVPEMLRLYDDYFKEVIKLYQYTMNCMLLLTDASELAGGVEITEIASNKDIYGSIRRPPQIPCETVVVNTSLIDPLVLGNILQRNAGAACLVLDGDVSENYLRNFHRILYYYGIPISACVGSDSLFSCSSFEIRAYLKKNVSADVHTLYVDFTRMDGSEEKLMNVIQAVMLWYGDQESTGIAFIIPFRELEMFMAFPPELLVGNYVVALESSEIARFEATLSVSDNIGAMLSSNLESDLHTPFITAMQNTGRLFWSVDVYMKTKQMP